MSYHSLITHYILLVTCVIIWIILVWHVADLSYKHIHIDSVKPHNKSAHKEDTERIAVLVYLDYKQGGNFAIEFCTFLYASWKYVMSHSYLTDYVRFKKGVSRRCSNHTLIDLIVFCHPTTCASLPTDCLKWSTLTQFDLKWMINSSNCMYRPLPPLTQNPNYPAKYEYLNTFSFLQHMHLGDVLMRYDWILRSDTDVFLTPTLLKWRPKYNLVTGEGGYGDLFNRQRLKNISLKLNLTHRGVTNFGSTWYGRPKQFLIAAKLTLNISRYLYENEFKPNLSGLEVIFTEGTDSNGKWPMWWRPVSTMYGSELALNHLIPGINQSYKAIDLLDAFSSRRKPALLYPHIHCWHGEAEFSKHRFINNITSLLHLDKELKSDDVKNLITDNIGDKNARDMLAWEYCMYIAWNAVGNHLPHVVTAILKIG
ncbi:unnamed protein product [Owenia fusiformis]|uniref:DUF7164 domain-containing protein n=1 Tax=Owenia fusiformis TaxID=6347 RepID=A0A8J1UC66_OWEFU|nr:unnamed protein product [Owenia fusiformis]